MARKNEIKNDSNKISFNTRTNTVMAEVSQENIKEKVSAVREVVSGRSNNEIVLVLQYYDNDVEKVIQAYLEDGAKEALTEWHYSGTKPIKKKRNKKKTQTPQPQTESPQSPVSVSSESGSATSLLVNGDTKEHMMNGVLDVNGTDVQKSKVIPNGNVSPVLNVVENKQAPDKKEISETTDVPHPHVPVTSIESLGSGVKVNENKVKEKSPSPLQQRQHHDNRHRSHSGSHNSADHRIRTSSTSSTGTDNKPAKKMPHHVLERSTKDLHRQTVSLERLRLVFNDEVDKSYKRIKSVFDEIRNCLNKREEELLGEMNSVRDMGRDTFTMRQGRAADLKIKIDRVERMTETELAELRNEIKHFVSDRKIDEDLGRTTRFVYADDTLKADIAKLGEVIPVKCSYIQRHPSLSSVDSGAPSEPDHISPVQKTVDDAEDSVKSEKKKVDIPHLDSAQTHEIAELQRRLKHSLTLEGIPVETFPERPVSVPPEETNAKVINSTARPTTATMGNNRNRQRRGPGRGGGPMNNQDRRERSSAEGGGPNYSRGFIQGADGERIILIGKGTRPQSGTGRPPRGGGRGGSRGLDSYRGGRGRGNSNARSPSGDSKKNEMEEKTENSDVNKNMKGSPRPRNENRNRRERGNSPRKQYTANSPNQQGGKMATNPAGLEKGKEPTSVVTISSE